jgi:hypothetical protein
MKTAPIAALFFLAGEAVACGYCVEDKIASTYDHAIVTRALARGHHVAFFHVDGAPVARRALEEATAGVPGIDKGSARISPDLLTLSFSFDPARASLLQLNTQLDRRLSARKASLTPLRIMEQPADLKTVKR